MRFNCNNLIQGLVLGSDFHTPIFSFCTLFFPLDYHLIYSVLRLEKRRSAWGEKGSVKIVSLVILLDMKGDGGKDRANQAFHFSFSVIYT